MEIFDRPPPSEDIYRTSALQFWRDREDSPLSLREVLAKFWARKRLIFISILVGAGLAPGYSEANHADLYRRSSGRDQAAAVERADRRWECTGSDPSGLPRWSRPRLSPCNPVLWPVLR